jgi:quercetin dioxygenase-like cupin family protein
MNEAEIIEQLKHEGYSPVYVWDAQSGEEDHDHAHSFDTRLVILDGKIRIGMDGEYRILKTAEAIDIPRKKIHSGLVGSEGCRYIVGEKH